MRTLKTVCTALVVGALAAQVAGQDRVERNNISSRIAAAVAQVPSSTSPSIRGVWQPVARTIPATTNPSDRADPFGHVPVGTQTVVQPGLLIFTQKHYSRTTDTAVQPRPIAVAALPDRPTVDELQARWGPFQANAGTYEFSGNVLTLHVFVAKNPAEQRPGNFARLTVNVEGDRLWLTPIENAAGRIVAGVTSEYVRVE